MVKQILHQIKIFGKIDFNVEYVKDENDITAQLFLAPPLSTNDLVDVRLAMEKLGGKYNRKLNRVILNAEARTSI